MRTAPIFAAALLISVIALGQSPTASPVSPPTQSSVSSPAASASLKCSKTVTFAVAEGGQPVPAIPKFATKWIGKGKHAAGYPQLCFSQIPSSSTYNYVVILANSESSFAGLTPSAHTYTSTGPLAENAGGISGYGGTWNYSYAGVPAPVTTSSAALQRIDASREKLILRAYDQEGRQVSNYSVDGNQSKEKGLDQVIGDVYRDSPEKLSHKRVATPLSVYYVNCDVDSPAPVSQVASLEPPVSPPATKPPLPPAIVEFLSNSTGAEIYLDGRYIGKTPFTITVDPGEHLVLMRKRDYSTWQQKLQAGTGPRRVMGYLERKVLILQ